MHFFFTVNNSIHFKGAEGVGIEYQGNNLIRTNFLEQIFFFFKQQIRQTENKVY